MSQDQYIYGSSRVAALEAGLLSESQMERMISAKSADEAFLALHDTFLAPYIAGKDRSYLPRGLRKSVSATKRLIAEMVPETEIFDVLWLKYDFFNLKTVIKGVRAGLTDEELHERCFYAGKYDLDGIIKAVRDKNTKLLPHADMVQAYNESQEVQDVYEIDFAMNRGYFHAISVIAGNSTDAFVEKYVSLVIDFFNLETQLRLLAMPTQIDREVVFMSGGTLTLDGLSSEEEILARYQKYGVAEFWKDAVEVFRETKDYAVLAKTADDYIVRVTKENSSNFMSSGPVFGYFLAHRNNTQIIKTIMVAKESDMQESDLRRILRRLYA